MSPDAEIFRDIAIELGVDPAFIEKDWYAIQVLAAIAAIEPDGIVPVFCGGTCLSKAHKLLKRFSEDLDFRGHFLVDGRASKPVRRRFRETVLATVEVVGGIELDRKRVKSGSSYFKFPLRYERVFDKSGALRPDLQVEFSYTQPKRGTETCSISSFIAEFSNETAEAEIGCLSPVETGADKFSALTWRVLKRDRDDENEDPAMIRHLHDLGALHSVISAQPDDFAKIALEAFQVDMSLNLRSLNYDLPTAAAHALEVLKTDEIYVQEYEQFVASMSYATDDEVIRFEMALERLNQIITLVEG